MAGGTHDDDGEPRPSEFGAILRHWRRARGISQLELASLAGLSTRHLSFLETGRCGPSREHACSSSAAPSPCRAPRPSGC